MSYGVGRRRSSDLVLLWLWRRPAAVALTQPLAWEHLYATGVALESKKRPKKKNIYISHAYHMPKIAPPKSGFGVLTDFPSLCVHVVPY